MAQVSPAVRADLAPTGTMRVGINHGNLVLAQKNATTGEVKGVAVDLAHELGRRLPALDVDLGAARQGVTAGPAGGLEQGARQGGHRRGAEIAVVAAPVPRQPPPHQRRVLGLDDDGRRRLPALGDRAPGDGQGVRHVEAAAHETTSRR